MIKEQLNVLINLAASDSKVEDKEAKVIHLIGKANGLSKEEVEKMVKQAEQHAGEDKKRKEAVEARNQLDSAIYQLEKAVKDAGDKLPADKKSKIESAIADAKKDLESNDAERMKTLMMPTSASAPGVTATQPASCSANRKTVDNFFMTRLHWLPAVATSSRNTAVA